MLHTIWMPAFEKVLSKFVAQAKGIPMDYWVVYNVFSACMSLDSELDVFESKGLKEAETAAFETYKSLWLRIESENDFTLAEEDIPTWTYLVSKSTFPENDYNFRAQLFKEKGEILYLQYSREHQVAL